MIKSNVSAGGGLMRFAWEKAVMDDFYFFFSGRH